MRDERCPLAPRKSFDILALYKSDYYYYYYFYFSCRRRRHCRRYCLIAEGRRSRNDAVLSNSSRLLLLSGNPPVLKAQSLISSRHRLLGLLASCAIQSTFKNVSTEVPCSDHVVKVLQLQLSVAFSRWNKALNLYRESKNCTILFLQ